MEIVLFWLLFKILSTFPTLSSVLNVEGQPGCLQSSAAGFQCLNRGNNSVECVLPMALQSQNVLSISEQNWTQTIGLLKISH
jgi:hypothetical protein